MNVMPQTRVGRIALWLLLPVVLYPLYASVLMLLPDSWRSVSIAIVFVIIALAVVSLVVAAIAIFRQKERSVVLIVTTALTALLVASFAVGEAIGH
ncbi:MAG TPA: hypothetical protein PKN27_06470 [Propionibacteriaceae bacterium]|nr:hypothetical protein [Propionibacteriaceae bacterium]